MACLTRASIITGSRSWAAVPTLGGLILGALAVCIIDQTLIKAAGFALAGGILTFFGLMHGEHIGIAQTPVVALSYGVVAVILFMAARFAVIRQHAAE